jgi:hypothetical protein
VNKRIEQFRDFAWLIFARIDREAVLQLPDDLTMEDYEC